MKRRAHQMGRLRDISSFRLRRLNRLQTGTNPGKAFARKR